MINSSLLARDWSSETEWEKSVVAVEKDQSGLKMVRAPCCEKMGLKKGPWTPEEDQVLIAYIMRYGHGNWRALPKQSGLLRCGKSCRLRWTNYLRPDIKRGNFSREEEDTIIKLHELLGNRWSAIAARLPGRTDNEIKNVWHTHLKKRLKQNPAPQTQHKPIEIPKCNADPESESIPKITDLEVPTTTHRIFKNLSQVSVSPEHSCSDFSSSSSLATDSSSILTSKNWSASLATSAIEDEDSSVSAGNLEENWPESFETMDSFWSEALQEENTTSASTIEPPQFQLPPCSPSSDLWPCNPYNDENMDFWFNLLMGTGQLSVMPEF